MNTIEQLFRTMVGEFPEARIVLYTPDDEDNASWFMRALRGHHEVTVEWHAGLDLMGVSSFGLLGLPDEIVSVHTATERVREALRH
jgi:hypothetical protein